MRRFQAPEYIGRNLVPVKPTKMNGQAFIGIVGIRPASALAKGRKPGEAHVMLGLGSAKQISPQTVEQAAKCVVTREAAFFDLTGDVLEAAAAVGDELALRAGEGDRRRDPRRHQLLQPQRHVATTRTRPRHPSSTITSTRSRMRSTLTTPRQLLVGMKDPETSREIRVDGRTILCMPGMALKVQRTNLRHRTCRSARS